MAIHFPRTEKEFSSINGVGTVKLAKYVEHFLKAIALHAKSKNEPIGEVSPKSQIQRNQSKAETVRLYREGLSIQKIGDERGLARSTIIAHLVEAIEVESQDIDLSRLIDPAKEEVIRNTIERVGFDRLAIIKEKLPQDYTYEEIRLVVAFFRRISV